MQVPSSRDCDEAYAPKQRLRRQNELANVELAMGRTNKKA